MTELCIKCNKEPILVKSRKLCSGCAQRFYQRRFKQKNPSISGSRYDHKVRFNNEVDFIRNFFKHSNWTYQPATFRFNGEIYQPDFYDSERNMFIEVAGTRQAFHDNISKYRKFIKAYPKIGFEIRYTSGQLLPFSESESTYHEVPEKR